MIFPIFYQGTAGARGCWGLEVLGGHLGMAWQDLAARTVPLLHQGAGKLEASWGTPAPAAGAAPALGSWHRPGDRDRDRLSPG